MSRAVTEEPFLAAESLAPAAVPVIRPERTAPAAEAIRQAEFLGPPYPRPRRRVPAACTADGALCIGPLTYLKDVCRAIGVSALQAGLDPHFFARLIWRESLYDAYAISHAGALGIAQFMPGTAAIRGLDDPFNPAKSLQASALYLRELQSKYGNLGLAAGAYNAGEGRIDRFLARRSGLPQETRAYIEAITGHSAESWRGGKPKRLDLRLDQKKGFITACVERAKARKSPSSPPGLPWGMIYAAHENRDTAAERAVDMRSRFPAILGDASIQVHRKKMPGSGRVIYTARMETATRMTASRICTRLRRAGGSCMVLKN